MSEHTYKAFYMDKDITLKASSQFDAWCKALIELQVHRDQQHLVSVMLTELDKNVTKINH